MELERIPAPAPIPGDQQLPMEIGTFPYPRNMGGVDQWLEDVAAGKVFVDNFSERTASAHRVALRQVLAQTENWTRLNPIEFRQRRRDITGRWHRIASKDGKLSASTISSYSSRAMAAVQKFEDFEATYELAERTRERARAMAMDKARALATEARRRRNEHMHGLAPGSGVTISSNDDVETRVKTEARTYRFDTFSTIDAPMDDLSIVYTSPGATGAGFRLARKRVMLDHQLPLLDGTTAELKLPRNLTTREALRISKFVQALAMDDPSLDPSDAGADDTDEGLTQL